MGFQDDYIMRQIELMSRFIAKFMFNSESISYEIENPLQLTQTDIMYNKIKLLISEKNFCEAENMLYENLDPTDKTQLALAVDFYNTLSRFSDDELEENNFSKEEIADGMRMIMKKFGIQNLPL